MAELINGQVGFVLVEAIHVELAHKRRVVRVFEEAGQGEPREFLGVLNDEAGAWLRPRDQVRQVGLLGRGCTGTFTSSHTFSMKEPFRSDLLIEME